MKFLICAAILVLAKAQSPVLLWPADDFDLPDSISVLQMIELEDFKKLFENKKVIVFHKKSFLLEEVSYPKKPLTYLQDVDAFALQGVKSMTKFLSSLTSSSNLKSVELPSEDLTEQQDLMEETMRDNPGYAAILVGARSHHLTRRDAPADAACQATTEECLVHVGKVVFKKAGAKDEEKKTCTVTCGNRSLTIAVDDMTISVGADQGGYKLTVNKPYALQTEVTWAPWKFSWSCGALTVSKIENGKVTGEYVLSTLQLWPDSQKAVKFGESFDCTTWFTTTLWMGVLVVLFYVFILFVAVLYLLEVKSNDRLDDPKGKTITVNVNE